MWDQEWVERQIGVVAVAWKRGVSRTSTPEHKRWADEVMRRDRFVCRLGLPGCMRRATEADHVVPVAEGGLRYDPLNGQAACESCHKIKTQQEAERGRARRSRLRPVRPHPSRA